MKKFKTLLRKFNSKNDEKMKIVYFNNGIYGVEIDGEVIGSDTIRNRTSSKKKTKKTLKNYMKSNTEFTIVNNHKIGVKTDYRIETRIDESEFIKFVETFDSQFAKMYQTIFAETVDYSKL